MREYGVVQLLGYEATDAQFIDPGIDYLTVEPEPETAKRLKDKVAKGFYFDVAIPGQQYELKHPEGEEETPRERGRRERRGRDRRPRRNPCRIIRTRRALSARP